MTDNVFYPEGFNGARVEIDSVGTVLFSSYSAGSTMIYSRSIPDLIEFLQTGLVPESAAIQRGKDMIDSAKSRS